MRRVQGPEATFRDALWLISAFAAMAPVSVSAAVSVAIVPVGNAGNAADPATGFGSVGYSYGIGEYDVTIGQYTAFLNAVAGTDPYGLYSPAMAPNGDGAAFADGIVQSGSPGSYTYTDSRNVNFPVAAVTWGDAARFCNWLTNGQPSGSEGNGTTETGSYILNGATSNAALLAVTRNADADYVIPTENEWYKAAYYNPKSGSYYLYATQSNMLPSNSLSTTGTNNANFGGPGDFTDPTNYQTVVGYFAGSPSPYGTFDQNGDVTQWNESVYSGSVRGLRGGSFYDSGSYLESTFNQVPGQPPAGNYDGVGFRVAQVPRESTSWTASGSGDWNNINNWSQLAPNAVGVEADFFGAITGNHTVFTDSPVTVGAVKFNNTAGSYYLAGAGPLTLQVDTGSASVDSNAGSHTIQLPVVIASSTVISAENGATLTISGPIVVDAATALSTTTTGTGAVVYESSITLQNGSSFSLASPASPAELIVGPGATAIVINHSSGSVNLLQLGSLSLSSGGNLDLSNNAAILHYADLGTVTGEVRSAYANGTWAGTGITSTTAANDSTHLTAIGILLNNNGSGDTIYPTFDGVASAATDILLKYTYYGDALLTGSVTTADYTQIDNGYLSQSGPGPALTGWQNGDFNYDNVINGSDYTLIDNAFNQQNPAGLAVEIARPTAQIAGIAASFAVPEPASAGLIGMAALGLLGRRRRAIGSRV